MKESVPLPVSFAATMAVAVAFTFTAAAPGNLFSVASGAVLFTATFMSSLIIPAPVVVSIPIVCLILPFADVAVMFDIMLPELARESIVGNSPPRTAVTGAVVPLVSLVHVIAA